MDGGANVDKCPKNEGIQISPNFSHQFSQANMGIMGIKDKTIGKIYKKIEFQVAILNKIALF